MTIKYLRTKSNKMELLPPERKEKVDTVEIDCPHCCFYLPGRFIRARRKEPPCTFCNGTHKTKIKEITR